MPTSSRILSACSFLSKTARNLRGCVEHSLHDPVGADGTSYYQRAPAEVIAPPPPPIEPRRRRVPIEIVEPDVPPAQTSNDFMSPVSTRKLKVPQAPVLSTVTESQRTSVTTTPTPASVNSIPPNPSARTGGGIFRRDGSHKVFGATQQEASSDTKPHDQQTTLDVDILPKEFAELTTNAAREVPTSLYVFDRNWMALKDPQSRWRYLQVRQT